ncbi:hypothetical protein [Moraxella equi]|nr:hypothetical protein [Moraxella equi]
MINFTNRLTKNRPNTFYGIRAVFMSDNLQGYHLQVVNHACSTQRF